MIISTQTLGYSNPLLIRINLQSPWKIKSHNVPSLIRIFGYSNYFFVSLWNNQKSTVFGRKRSVRILDDIQ